MTKSIEGQNIPVRSSAEVLSLATTLDRDGFVVVRNVLPDGVRADALAAADALLASASTIGRDSGSDDMDGFRGVINHDPKFWPLLARPDVLAVVAATLGANIRLLSSHLIALPSVVGRRVRTIRVPSNPGWHRDMFGVTRDLGWAETPRLAIKCAFYLSQLEPGCGVTSLLPGSHRLTHAPEILSGDVDPAGAVVPDLQPGDVLLFENRTFHAGGINTAGHPRVAVMMQYGYRWLAPVDDPLPADDAEIFSREPLARQLVGGTDRAADGSMSFGAGSAAVSDWVERLGLPSLAADAGAAR